MFVRIKTQKRRAYQTVVHKIFKTEVTTDDSEFEKCVSDFKSLEKQLTEILKSVIDNREMSERWSARNAHLGCLVAAHFNSDQRKNGCKLQSYEYMNAMTNMHKVVQNACTLLIEKHVVEPLEKLLNDSFLTTKRFLLEHQGLQKDLESYRRRVKRLQEKGRQGNDKDMIKLTRKLARTQASYDQMHAEIMHELKQTYNSRHEVLQPCFVAILACQGLLHNELTGDLNKVFINMNSEEIERIQAEVQRIIRQGGPTEQALAGIRRKRNPPGMFSKSLRSMSLSKRKESKSPKEETTGPIPELNLSENLSEGFSPVKMHDPPTSSHVSSPASYSSGHHSTPGNPRLSDHSTSSAPESHSEEYPVESVMAERKEESLASTSQHDGGSPKLQKVVAAFDYHEGDDSDLFFSEGDVITVLDKIDVGWWKGQLENGTIGLFPVTYVKSVDDDQEIAYS